MLDNSLDSDYIRGWNMAKEEFKRNLPLLFPTLAENPLALEASRRALDSYAAGEAFLTFSEFISRCYTQLDLMKEERRGT